MAKQQSNSIQRLWEAIKPNFLVQKNTIGANLAGIPLFNKSRTLTVDDFAPISLTDVESYKGYLYSAIRKRSNRVAQLATENIKTRLKDNDDATMHPYLALVDSSTSFSNHYFWKALSTYLDLEGVAYLLAVRNFSETKFGAVQNFKIINPYNLHKVINSEGQVGGYIEYSGNAHRELPLQMVIPINDLNPFNLSDGYAMTDAAKESQYLHKQSGAFTRSALKKNVGTRGLITTDIILEDDDFENFKGRVRASGGPNGAGDFLFGNGPGSINYQDMQIDLDKLALEKISEVSTQELFAVAGVSKTIMGIEVSGVTRETGKVQQDNFDRFETIPQLQTIIDALNQDYKNSYAEEYKKSPLVIYIDSPLKTDREAELKDAETMKAKAETAKILIETGFDAAEVLEEVGLGELTFEKPAPPVQLPPAEAPPAKPPKEEQEHVHTDHDHLEVDINTANPIDGLEPIIRAKETSLENDVVNVQKQIFQAIRKRVDKNELTPDQEKDVITKTDKNRLIDELEAIFEAFGLSVIGLFANRILRKRFEQFAMTAEFNMTKAVRDTISTHAKAAAASHMTTILDEVYAVARQAASEGLGRQEIISRLNNLFSEKITKARATRIARTEANMLTAEAQYQADLQFVSQNDLKGRAFKRWVVRSDNPCQYCLTLQAETARQPIPFHDPFREVGQSVDVSDEGKQQSYVVGFEDITAGTLHPNCSCIYEIIIVND